jgi:hypothetical protein
LASHAAVPVFASESKGLAPENPALGEVEAHVEGRNWKSPDAPEYGL